MKSIALWVTISTLVLLQGSASDVQKCSVITPETREKIGMLAHEHPTLMKIFLPEQPNAAKVPMSLVPQAAKANATVWIPRVVQERWLPAEIESKFVALKDVKLWEKRDKNGILIWKDVGDFLTLDYEVSGCEVHVQESGVSLSLRVDFREALPVGDDPAGFIRKCLTDFLNIPEGVVLQLQGDVEEEPPLYVAHLRSPAAIERVLALLQTPEPNEQERERLMRERHWWDRISVCTDGYFFFASVSELEPDTNPRAKGGLPDRF